ncbi:MAG: hypothetical protein AAGA01_04000 [Cyanobacteria bacterium P01_E01_bin.43]
MPRVVVYLDEVRCHDTEDKTGKDEVYVIGAVKTSDSKTSEGFVTRPINIDDDETLKFGPGGGYVFDEQLPRNGLFQIEMTALDEDTAKTASDYEQAKKAIDKALATVPNPRVAAVGSLTVEAADAAVRLDKDDELGTLLKPFSVSQIPDGWTLHRWDFEEEGLGWSTWKYEILYWVGKF